MICYSGGVCSAPVLFAGKIDEMSNHCDMSSHANSDASQESKLELRNSNSGETNNSNCCYEALTSSSSIKDHINQINPEVLYVMELPNSIFYKNSTYTDKTFAGSTHDPPDICLSVSRLLL
jgi:hypothetical protein